MRFQSIMKSLASKVLIISVAAGMLLIGGIILVQRKQAWTELQPRRYPHEHLPSSAWEPKAKLPAGPYNARKDDTLASVARLRYGHQNYQRVIKIYNHIEDEAHIEAGSTLRVPDISTILAEEGFAKVAAGEMELILCSRAKYDKVVDKLWALRVEEKRSYAVPEEVARQLLEAADDLQQATEDLKMSKTGVSAVPKSMIGQLEQNMRGMRDLARGEHSDPNGYDIDMVQQRYALALAYAIIWAREGFK